MKKSIFVLTCIFAIALVACKKKPEPVAEAPKPAVEVKKEPLSPEVEAKKSLKKWETFNSWDFVKPFHDKYLFTTSYEVPKSRRLLPVGNPYHPEYAETVFLFESLKNEGCKIFVPNNAIATWGTYKEGEKVHYFAYDSSGKELPKRKK
jgi:hypothetical protein